MKNFPEVSDKNDDLLDLEIEEFLSIISDDMLNVKSEQIVWEACVKWLDKDPENRSFLVVRLLTSIRFAFMENSVS